MPQDCLDRLRVLTSERHPGTTGMPQAVEIESFTLVVHIHEKRAGFPLAVRVRIVENRLQPILASGSQIVS